jgi:hypothetical protein
MYASSNLDTVVERNAHKWAADPSVSVDTATGGQGRQAHRGLVARLFGGDE